MTRPNCCASYLHRRNKQNRRRFSDRINHCVSTRLERVHLKKGCCTATHQIHLCITRSRYSREDSNLCHTMARDVRPQSGRKNVSSRLDRVKDWPAVATKAGFKIGRIAKEKKISVRNLHRFIRGRFGKSPKRWVDELKAAHAAAELAQGQSAKAITIAVKYAHESSFCRFFKRVTGSTTRNHVAGVDVRKS